MSLELYGCFIIGPSGAGKTTLAFNLANAFNFMNRPYCLINLDPALEDDIKYDVDIRELINLEDVMTSMNLGYFMFK